MLKGMEKGRMMPRGSANRYARNISGDKSKGLVRDDEKCPYSVIGEVGELFILQKVERDCRYCIQDWIQVLLYYLKDVLYLFCLQSKNHH